MKDVVIIGAGIAGLALALALKTALGNTYSIVICDPALGHSQAKSRVSALSGASCALLDRLQVWSSLLDKVQPILKMCITDSRMKDAVRLPFLTFEADEDGKEPLAQMVFHHDLEEALIEKAKTRGVEFYALAFQRLEQAPQALRLTFEDGTKMATRLLVGADGASSRVRQAAPIPAHTWRRTSTALVATLRHSKDHAGIAYEHFLPEGPLGLLPLTDQRLSIVWALSPEHAQAILNLPQDQQIDALYQRIGHEFGNISLEDGLQSWPLTTQIARKFYARRLALVGDAAHVIHPLAGQGMNLALRDVASLAELVVDQSRLGLDLGSFMLLSEYGQARRVEALGFACAMEALDKLFSNDNSLLRPLRDLGLGIVDRCDFLKHFFMQEAAGKGENVPKLLQGLSL